MCATLWAEVLGHHQEQLLQTLFASFVGVSIFKDDSDMNAVKMQIKFFLMVRSFTKLEVKLRYSGIPDDDLVAW